MKKLASLVLTAAVALCTVISISACNGHNDDNNNNNCCNNNWIGF